MQRSYYEEYGRLLNGMASLQKIMDGEQAYHQANFCACDYISKATDIMKESIAIKAMELLKEDLEKTKQLAIKEAHEFIENCIPPSI